MGWRSWRWKAQGFGHWQAHVLAGMGFGVLEPGRSWARRGQEVQALIRSDRQGGADCGFQAGLLDFTPQTMGSRQHF
jgi:hypothetical protein